MDNIELKDIQIKTLKDNKLLSYQDYSFIKCKYKDRSYGFYKKDKSEWKPFLGLLVDEEKSYKLGILVHKIIESKINKETERISFCLGGGKWLTQNDRGSFLNLENVEKDNIYYQINKFIDSPYMKYIRNHKDNFYYFSKEDRNYDYLENKEIQFKNLKSLDDITKNINNYDFSKISYQNYSLIPYLSFNNLEILEKIFIYHNNLSLNLKFYLNSKNKNLILRYNLIYYYQNDDFKFKYLLYQEIKNLKDVYLGKTKKIVTKQVRDYNLINRTVKEIIVEDINLIDILLNLNVEFVLQVTNLNSKLFTNTETKKYIKTKTTDTNHHISSHLLKLK